MDVNKILNADFLDILFDGRNKEYGAYELRRSYNKRLTVAISAMILIALLIFLGSVISKEAEKNKKAKMEVQDVKLEEVKEQPKNEPPPPPPPPKMPEPPKIEITKFTPPKIVKDEEVKEDEKPPEMEKIEEAKIGTINQEGTKDDGIVAPPVESKGTGDVVAPKAVEEDYDKVFTKVENPAEFPGGPDAWRRYLERNLQYPDNAQENGTQGVVRVQFIVDKEGNISEVQALNDPGDGLAEEAVRIIKKGPKWTPAEQNGRKVIYRHIQAITFRLE
ncbi:TonB family protein [Phnomibacter ginsenosidimutans]|uniref:TonB family protein n=2 Tax=Phnomibacter ginsenosidimutans TaxID=2676868 RepID=A0A6I6GBA2_9BACT|nr:energy transducer TonB [Phnomibacter ginsenosidimutans]QGW29977.1 TonB family protein [Phnomibacter ginsenosidimutans]